MISLVFQRLPVSRLAEHIFEQHRLAILVSVLRPFCKQTSQICGSQVGSSWHEAVALETVDARHTLQCRRPVCRVSTDNGDWGFSRQPGAPLRAIKSTTHRECSRRWCRFRVSASQAPSSQPVFQRMCTLRPAGAPVRSPRSANLNAARVCEDSLATLRAHAESRLMPGTDRTRSGKRRPNFEI